VKFTRDNLNRSEAAYCEVIKDTQFRAGIENLTASAASHQVHDFVDRFTHNFAELEKSWRRTTD
jgi:hypothetical protein